MRIPKYSNPQLVPDATRIVSRRALQFEDDTGDGVTQDGEAGEVGLERKEVDDLYAELDKIVSKRLKLKRVPEPSEESPSGKKRKILAEDGKPAVGPQQHSEPVAFRLVSSSLPPRAIHLSPKPAKVMLVKEPNSEDTEQELRERVYRAALSAVDLDQIKHTFAMANECRLPQLLRASSQPQTAPAPLLLLEVPLTTLPPLPWTNPRFNVPPKPSPHQLSNEGICCPIVSVAPLHDRDTCRKRRRGKPKNKNKLVP